MQVRTTYLSGVALRYAVSIAEGAIPTRCEHRGRVWFVIGTPSLWTVPQPIPAYDCGPAGADIAIRESITVVKGNPLYSPHGNERGQHYEALWLASKGDKKFHGRTPEEAAMRCHVFYKLGEFVELPEELL